MRYQVTVRCSTSTDPRIAFNELAAYNKLAARAGAVVEHVDAIRYETVGQSSWRVHFRRGTLCWTQSDAFDADRGEIRFEATSGDPLEFRGRWTVKTQAERTVIEFTAIFDLGIPTLGEFLDPLAAESLAENVSGVLTSVFADASLEQVVSCPAPEDHHASDDDAASANPAHPDAPL